MNSQSALQGIPENVTIADLSRYIVQTNRKYDLSIIVSAYEFAVLHMAIRSVLPVNRILFIHFRLLGSWYLWVWILNVSVPGYCMMWWKIPSIRWMMSVSGSDGILPCWWMVSQNWCI